MSSLVGAPKIQKPEREATYLKQLQNVLKYLGFRRFDESAQQDLDTWLHRQTQQSFLPEKFFEQAEIYLFEK